MGGRPNRNPTAQLFFVAVTVVVGAVVFAVANGQYCNEGEALPNNTAGLYVNYTSLPANSSSFPGPTVGACTNCGSNQTIAYIYQGNSSNSNLNAVLTPNTTAFPLLQCPTTVCICNTSNCWSTIGVSSVYFVTYCPPNNSTACQIYAVLNCYSGGVPVSTASKYFSGKQHIIRYTCSEQVLANGSWAPLLSSGVFPLPTYAQCGNCPAAEPLVSAGNCTNCWFF